MGLSGRVFGTLCLAFFTDSLSYSIVAPFLPAYIDQQLGIKTLAQLPISLMLSTFGLGALATTPVWTYLSLRFNCKTVFCTAAFLLFLSAFFVALPLWTIAVPWLLIFRALQGAASMGTWVTGMAFLGQSYPTAKMGAAFGKLIGFMSIGLLVGPGIGGWLYDLGGIYLPYGLITLLALLYGMFMFMFLESPAEEYDFTMEWDWAALKNKHVLSVAAIILISSQAMCAIDAAAPLFMSSTLKLPSSTIGMVLMGSAVATAVGSPLAGWMSDSHGALRTLYAFHIMSAISLPLMALSALFVNWTAVAVCIQVVAGMLTGATLAGLVTPCFPRLMEIFSVIGNPSTAAIQTSLLQNVTFTLGTVVGPLLASLVVVEFNFFWSMTVCGGLLLLYCCFLVWLNSGEGAVLNSKPDKEEYMQLHDDDDRTL